MSSPRDLSQKRAYGQFFTTENPFTSRPFVSWLKATGLSPSARWVEPFAGENGIIEMMRAVPGYANASWEAYDIEIQAVNRTPDVPVMRQDTISEFPGHFDIAVTNPPYLAKNSATRRHLPYAGGRYDDLYKRCLEVMLGHCDRVAAIIPESFITSGLFQDRLDVVISLACKMFEDTECPVCLACFGTELTGDFEIYVNEERIGSYADMREASESISSSYRSSIWKFNVPSGSIGIHCIDSTGDGRIRFVKGDEIPSSQIKVTSRSLTRVGGCPDDIDPEAVISECNALLRHYRDVTQDVLLTSFKGLRKDGRYRRRMDFACARGLLCAALERIQA